VNVNDSHFAQHTQMLGNSRLGKAKLEHQFSHIALGPQAEQIDNLPPTGFGDGVENIGGGCCPRHAEKYIPISEYIKQKKDDVENIAGRFEPSPELQDIRSAISDYGRPMSRCK
jgi:hypothetical protein